MSEHLPQSRQSLPPLPFWPGAVLFDLDGTLADSERDAADSLDQVLRGLGRPLAPAERDYVIGHGWPEIYQNLQQHAPVPLTLPELEHAAYLARVELAATRGVTALPSAAALVRRVAGVLPCALVTGSSRDEALLVLTTLGLSGCFAALCCAGEAPRGKPAPDPYLRAAAALQVPPARCLVIEDSTAGIASARAAGMLCVAVRAGNFAGQDQSAADLIVDTLAEVDALLWPR